jgi:NADPH-dependent 2,4-dienoyl-CoA reductase/sulfur reductase-like enzyme
VLVVGVGVAPAVDWLAGSGIERRDGIVADEHLAVRDEQGATVPGVFAAGDVARWFNPLFGEEMRVEHWTNAAEQGAHAATNLLAADRGAPLEPYAPVPFFWSDQFEHRIQFLGRAAAHDTVEVVAGSVDDHRFLALYGRDGIVCGALGVNAPRWVMPVRADLLARARFDDAVAAAVERAGPR